MENALTVTEIPAPGEGRPVSVNKYRVDDSGVPEEVRSQMQDYDREIYVTEDGEVLMDHRAFWPDLTADEVIEHLKEVWLPISVLRAGDRLLVPTLLFIFKYTVQGDLMSAKLLTELSLQVLKQDEEHREMMKRVN